MMEKKKKNRYEIVTSIGKIFKKYGGMGISILILVLAPKISAKIKK